MSNPAVDAWLADRQIALQHPGEWEDDMELLDSDQRQTAREELERSTVIMTPALAAEVVQTPRKRWVNPYEALLDEVTRTAAYVEMLEVEVRDWDSKGGAHRFKGGRPLLARFERERDRLERNCKTAIGLGIAERQVRLAEKAGQVMITSAVAALDKVGVTQEQKQLIMSELVAQLRIHSQAMGVVNA